MRNAAEMFSFAPNPTRAENAWASSTCLLYGLHLNYPVVSKHFTWDTWIQFHYYSVVFLKDFNYAWRSNNTCCIPEFLEDVSHTQYWVTQWLFCNVSQANSVTRWFLCHVLCTKLGVTPGLLCQVSWIFSCWPNIRKLWKIVGNIGADFQRFHRCC